MVRGKSGGSMLTRATEVEREEVEEKEKRQTPGNRLSMA
jgi:hypothetical protein